MTAPESPPGDTDPLWFKDAVIYQLHVKSFFDSNGDGIGDLAGLTRKLDYIAALGATAIWLLPFYPSPRRDDGYDISEYCGVHPDYGNLEDARRLIDAAHAKGLRVVTELVINHTSDQHEWFQRARLALPGSPERDMYVWSDTKERYAGTRIIFVDSEASNWTWDDAAGAYYWHRFYSHQPDLNFDNPAVLQEVLAVMRFWLDLGVDGLRLDAVPYLVEREGTSNENLPETHAILKRIRAELDRHAPGRMLLAEANQWPEDAIRYFGEGDECHMAFHFPLMPRLFMALAQADRFPIIDILRQTPGIPATCQWALFLRNHDELTLEMVTAAERESMWRTYAPDPRARLNLGIRRRLAPLLQHDRSRIELLNSLLLSLQGTPVLYYGDEIGMGDNVALHDRDGVRTPMQWSADSNGGFSDAEASKLVLSLVTDPVYGVQAVNVAAQVDDPCSLLNWTRRMLAVRRRHPCFGRGTQRFLYPRNPGILAFLREMPEGAETILCVGNLSSTAQAAELDLTDFPGRIPVELLGGAAFPAITAAPYTLTLAPHGFLWLLLAEPGRLPAWRTVAPEPPPDIPTLVIRDGMDEALVLPGLTEALPAYLPRRRWFAAKADRLLATRMAYTAALPGAGDLIRFAEVEAELPGRTERYVLPLGLAWDNLAADTTPVARVRSGRHLGRLIDASALDGLTHGLLAGLRGSLALPLPEGELRFLPAPGMADVPLAAGAAIRRLPGEQSNTSWIVGERLVLKLIRLVLAGIHPEAEMTGHLTQSGFANTPKLLGEIVRMDAAGVPHTVALAHGFVPNQGDGWRWTLHHLAGAGTSDYATFARSIGTRLGELHALLAQPSDDPGFAPEPANAAAAASWGEGAAGQIAAAVDALSRFTAWPHDAARRQAEAMIENQAALVQRARELARHGNGALQTRVHGDFHLGQVLVAGDDAFIIDFEGEPARSLAQRRAKSCPLRDVAGLLRSLDYAEAAQPASLPDRLREVEHASAAFLGAYAAVLNAATPRWVAAAASPGLLDLFLLEKVAYEIRYEAANRPSWIGIPIKGMTEIAGRLLGQEGSYDA